MDRYINREALLQSIRDGAGTRMQKIFAECCVLAVPIAADVVEVKHGEWEKASEYMPIYRCSTCKERNLFKDGDNVFSNYCPSCGAKMDGERREE